ncbi:MAG: ribulose-phosphate 3-epimerase, partial [Ginsengibacter sp.]
MTLAPSILAADFLNLGNACKIINESEADWFHLDVMDGRFVPNTTFFANKIRDLRKITSLPFDAHLMIEEPLK